MCDTLALLVNGQTFLAKNSDREPQEPQRVEWHPPKTQADEALTYLTIPRKGPAYGCWISRPDWMWGAEMGINEHGVCIGNEAVFTKLMQRKQPALLGMDLLRLGLEEAITAYDALLCMTQYLEKYGQGGPAGYKNKSFHYDNSFLIADKQEVWQLETAGKFWVAKSFQQGESKQVAAISNSLTIETDYDLACDNLECGAFEMGLYRGKGKLNFKKTFSTWFMPWAGKAKQRRQCSLMGLQSSDEQQNIPEQLAQLLQTHVKALLPSGNGDVCMHSAGFHRPSETTQSMITEISPDKFQVWMTGNSLPCQSLYKPMDEKHNWLQHQEYYWEKWADIYGASNKAQQQKLRKVTQEYQSLLWRADGDLASNLLDAWWQKMQAL